MSTQIELSANYQDPDEATGQSVLPQVRMVKIIKIDEDVYQCNKQARYLICVSTEMFIQFLVEQGVRFLGTEQTQRKTVHYKDLANAVTKLNNLEFLSDVIPATK
ncbi:hypothetical protein BDD12DRAFT_407593 [Trichophaea hybrida]|nr:hypothetical protein BDD12DRAFT_407593 [Trichophaea hybrida]